MKRHGFSGMKPIQCIFIVKDTIGKTPFRHSSGCLMELNYLDTSKKLHIFAIQSANRLLTIGTLTNANIMEEIISKVKSIIVDKLGVDESEVVESASFTNDLGADSLDTVELIMEFEKTFDITIPDDVAEKINTVQDAVDFISQSLQK